MKITDKISKGYHLTESGQGNTEVKFAMINGETGETITPFCKCKDYFTDMFWSKKIKEPVQIYGFKWQPEQSFEVLDKEQLFIAVKLVDRSSNKLVSIEEKKLITVKALLNKFEKELKWKLTKVEYDDDKEHIILTIPNSWQDKPYLVSALFYLIRLGFTYDGETDPIEFFSKAKSSDYIAPYDESYFKKAKNKLEDLLKGKIEKNQTYKMYTAGTIHSTSGIVGYQSYSI